MSHVIKINDSKYLNLLHEILCLIYGEFIGVFCGLKLAIQLGLDNVVLETDSLPVVNEIKN